MIIGIFDSGKGAWLVKAKLEKLLPEHQYVVATDTAHLPYGSRTEAELKQLVDVAIQPLLTQTKLIVVACNTATAATIDWLRERYPSHSFVGYEPMIKAAAGLTKHFCVLATESTRRSARYLRLKEKWASDCVIDEPATLNWARLIETNHVDEIDLTDVSNDIKRGSDVIVLACTHYLELQQPLQELFPDVKIIEPTPAVASRINELIAAGLPR